MTREKEATHRAEQLLEMVLNRMEFLCECGVLRVSNELFVNTVHVNEQMALNELVQLGTLVVAWLVEKELREDLFRVENGLETAGQVNVVLVRDGLGGVRGRCSLEYLLHDEFS